MALKGPLWVLANARAEERSVSHLAHLSSRALDLGLSKVDKTRGHLFQAVGAVQRFFADYPQHVATVTAAAPHQPFKPAGTMLNDWKTFLAANQGPYGNAHFGYNYDTLRNILTKKYAGTRKGGGGGDNELEICFRLVAEFI